MKHAGYLSTENFNFVAIPHLPACRRISVGDVNVEVLQGKRRRAKFPEDRLELGSEDR